MLYTRLTELAFKRYGLSPAAGATKVAFYKLFMDLFVYSDESGVFDYVHNPYFVFAGIICFGKKDKDDLSRKYKHFEDTLRGSRHRYSRLKELKASRLSNADKGKAYRSLNHAFKFCVLIDENRLNKNVFEHKRHKQRYLDYAYKMVLKKCFSSLIKRNAIVPQEVQNIHVYVDEHSTATDGRYELHENLFNEFKIGTFNLGYHHYFDPIFPRMAGVDVRFCDSAKTILVRGADIIANHCFHLARTGEGKLTPEKNLFILYMPANRIGGYGA